MVPPASAVTGDVLLIVVPSNYTDPPGFALQLPAVTLPSLEQRLFALKAAYPVYLLQNQWTNSSPLVLDVFLTELMPVLSDRADFPDGVLITHPVKQIVDPPCGRLLKRVVWADVDYLTVPGKGCW